jgi:hypothetical protein
LNDVKTETILDDVQLIDTLNDAKETQAVVKETLASAKIAMKKIDETRN